MLTIACHQDDARANISSLEIEGSPYDRGIMRKKQETECELCERKRREVMEKPDERSTSLPYGEVEALQPYYQQLQDQYQTFMDHHKRLQDRYQAFVNHHDLLEKLYGTLMNHRYRLQDQHQVLEDYHRALQDHDRMGQDYLQTLREHLQALQQLSRDRA